LDIKELADEKEFDFSFAKLENNIEKYGK